MSADEDLIEQARLVARSLRKTLNAAFREWLLQFTSQAGDAHDLDALLRRLRHVNAGRRFTLIVAAAMESGCDVLYSEDLQDGQRFDDLKVENPFL